MLTKLLFIDDDLAVLGTYQRMLRHTSYQCDFASDPVAILHNADLSDVAVLFVDQRMPQLSGSQFFEELQGRYPLMKRVLISGDISIAASELNKSVCVSAFLEKPCSKMTLINCIKQLLDEQ